MITLFNRKEVYNGFSLNKFNKIKNILISNNIKYVTKVINRKNSKIFGPTRSYSGSFGERTELTYTYYLYVHNSDYDKTILLINKNKNTF